MTAGTRLGLSGRWTGIYNYPAEHPPNRFEASLREVHGALAGTVWERDAASPGGGTLHALSEGRRDGPSVAFTKLYDDLERIADPIFYNGTVQPDGNEISGTWSIVGVWSGTFLMIRSAGAEEAVGETVGETVGSGR
ncbi:MAG TPA: hypothetical protein VF547_07035 [Allosphingosinicella sp.]